MYASNRKVINLAITITTSLATCLIVMGIVFQIGFPTNTLEANGDKSPSNTSSFDVHPDFYKKAGFMLPDSLPNFVGAAQNTTECVVHIRSKSTSKSF